MDSQNRAQLFAKGADSTLALLVYAAAAIALMVLDRRLGYLNDVRATAQSLALPIWALAELPQKAMNASKTYLGERAELEHELLQLRETSLIQSAQLSELRTALIEAGEVRALLGESGLVPAHSLADQATRQNGIVARVMSLDLDRYSQRIAIGRGAHDGIVVNSALVDQYGLLGQVTEVGASTSVAILLTDVNHRIPAEVVRSGLRVYVVGLGSGMLAVDRMALTSDIKAGDQLRTSGMGGVFPAGLAIGNVVQVTHAAGDSFAQAQVQPAAKMELNKVVLVLSPRPVVGPLFEAVDNAQALPRTNVAPK